jgi:hypothetical protein
VTAEDAQNIKTVAHAHDMDPYRSFAIPMSIPAADCGYRRKQFGGCIDELSYGEQLAFRPFSLSSSLVEWISAGGCVKRNAGRVGEKPVAALTMQALNHRKKSNDLHHERRLVSHCASISHRRSL